MNVVHVRVRPADEDAPSALGQVVQDMAEMSRAVLAPLLGEVAETLRAFVSQSAR
jgi:hypothetical protein